MNIQGKYIVTKFLFLCFFLLHSYASFFAQVPTEISTYKWHKISEKDITQSGNYSTSLFGNGVLKRMDSSIYILALDTLGLKINVTLSDSSYIIDISVKPNDYFNPKWEKLPFGEVPTPLSKKEYSVFSIFSQYRILNEPISKFLPESFKIDLNDGKIYFLNFWYYGCLPCMAEIPALNELNELYKNDHEVQIISFFRDSIISVDDTSLFQTLAFSSSGAKFKAVDINLKVVPNSQEFSNLLNVRSYPTNILVDKKGIIREVIIGASVSPEKNKELVSFYKTKIKGLK